jgi:UDP-2-acetamido-3-amino-2,3-dideoxy-glucuronate N-acetyltransferase
LYEKTLVRRGATIGANATIVCGRTLGRHCFVAAGAVVTGEVDDYALMVGVPARHVGWMSRHGHVLAKKGDPDGVYTCLESKLRYELAKGRMRGLDVGDDAPLPEDLAVGTKSYRDW